MRKRVIKITPDELCSKVSENTNISKKDVAYVLDALIVQIQDLLCEAEADTNVWVKVSSDIAFKGVYSPAGKGGRESVIPTLQMSDYGKYSLEDNYYSTQFYKSLVEKYGQSPG